MTNLSPIPYIQKLSRTQETGAQGVVFGRFPASGGQEV